MSGEDHLGFECTQNRKQNRLQSSVRVNVIRGVGDIVTGTLTGTHMGEFDSASLGCAGRD